MLRASSSSSSTSSPPPSSPRLAFLAPTPRPLPSPTPPLPLELTRSQLLNKLARPCSSSHSSSTTTFTRTDLTALVHSFLVAATSPSSGLDEPATPLRWTKPFIQTFLYVSRSIRSLGEDEPGRLLLDSLPRELRRAVEARCGCARVRVPPILLGKRARVEEKEEERELPFPKMETLVETAFELLKEAREQRPPPPPPPPPSPSSSPTVVPLGAGHTFTALRCVYGRSVYGRSTADRWSRQFADAVGFDPDKPLGGSLGGKSNRKLETALEETEQGAELERREGAGPVRKKARRRSISMEEQHREK